MSRFWITVFGLIVGMELVWVPMKLAGLLSFSWAVVLSPIWVPALIAFSVVFTLAMINGAAPK